MTDRCGPHTKHSFSPCKERVNFTGNIRVSNSGSDMSYFCFSKCPIRFWVPTTLLFTWYLCYFPGVQRSGREFDCLPSSSSKVKSEWSCFYSPYMPSCPGERKLYPFYLVPLLFPLPLSCYLILTLFTLWTSVINSL